ncbi:MAG: 2Fe-2S iron-sulfur cluster binding domain-containing protein [Alphaproteobacteria bacterium]|nr:2Fe-2S iron-sulfur cluster binding domain-containing protein [Alphaproteobacteria bacterium]
MSMSFTVKVSQFETPVSVEMGDTILETALRLELPYPHGCRSGNCGACKSELIAGDVELSPYSEFALTAEERARGLILACRAVPWSDCEVAHLESEDVETHPSRHLRCSVISAEPATHDIRVIRLRIESGGPFDFSPGQYASLVFPDLPPRDYSMANMPGGDELEFHIRLIPDGAVTPYVQEALKVGDEVRVRGPFGTSYLRRNHNGPIVALAGGSGIAPIKSIIDSALDAEIGQSIYLYFGVRDERDLYLERYFDELAATHANFHFIPVLSEPTKETTRRTGFLHESVRSDFTDLDGCKGYLAGPPPMVEAATRVLTSLGIRRQDCHADAFYTEADKAAGKGA